MQKTSPSSYDLPPSYVPPTSFSSGNVLVSSSSPVFRPPLFRALPLQTSFSGGTTGITGRTFRPKNPRPFVLPKPSKTSSNCDLPFSYVPSSSSSSCSSSYSSSSSTTGSPSSSSASSPVVQALPLPPRAPILTSREARIGGGKIDRSDHHSPPPLPPRTYILLSSFPTTTTKPETTDKNEKESILRRVNGIEVEEKENRTEQEEQLHDSIDKKGGDKEDIKTNDDSDNISVSSDPPPFSSTSTSSSTSFPPSPASSTTSLFSGLKAKSCDYLSESSSLQKSYSTSHLKEKLDLMKMERMSLRNDYEQNERFGSSIVSRFTLKYALNQLRVDKLTNHSNEVDTISRLVVSLRIRLKHLNQEEQENEESEKKSKMEVITVETKQSHERSKHPENSPAEVTEKRKKLNRQLNEALDLKQLIDNRSHVLMDKLLSGHHYHYQQQKSSDHQEGEDEVTGDDTSTDKTDFLEYVMNKSNIIMRLKEVEDEIHSIEKSLDLM